VVRVQPIACLSGDSHLGRHSGDALEDQSDQGPHQRSGDPYAGGRLGRRRDRERNGPETTPPSTPTGLAATAGSPTQINLSWTVSTDNIGVAGYKAYRNAGYVGSSPTTSYPDTGLTVNTQYAYKVSAYDDAGNESAQSSQVGRCTLRDRHP
jgi:hypothetical protein